MSSFEKPPSIPSAEIPQQEHARRANELADDTAQKRVLDATLSSEDWQAMEASRPSVEAQRRADFLKQVLTQCQTLTEAQKIVLTRHLETKPGLWREIDGDETVLVTESIQVENNCLTYLVSAYGMDMEERIPLEGGD